MKWIRKTGVSWRQRLLVMMTACTEIQRTFTNAQLSFFSLDTNSCLVYDVFLFTTFQQGKTRKENKAEGGRDEDDNDKKSKIVEGCGTVNRTFEILPVDVFESKCRPGTVARHLPLKRPGYWRLC